MVETRAGAGAGFADNNYQAAGAEIVANADTIFGRAELIVKVAARYGAQKTVSWAGAVHLSAFSAGSPTD